MKKILLTILAVLAMAGMAMAQTAPSDINLHRNDDGTWSFTLVDEFSPVTSITLNKTSTTIYKGFTETLSVTSVLPANATDPTVTWSSNATGVATVNATTGVVTAVAAGTATITATANDGSGVTATCAVTVTIPPVSTYLTDGAMVVVEFVDEYGEHTSVGGEYSNGLGAFTSVDYNHDGGTLTKNGNIIHAWVKSSHESEATIDINITNNTYTVSYVNGSVMFTGLSSVFIGDTNVKNLLTRVTN